MLYLKGLSQTEIARQIGVHDNTVYNIVHDPEFIKRRVEFEEKVTDKARKLFEENAIHAAEQIIRISKKGKPDERIQLDASKEILYQVGLKPVEVIETRKRDYTPEEVQQALQTAMEVETIAKRLGINNSRFIVDKSNAKPESD